MQNIKSRGTGCQTVGTLNKNIGTVLSSQFFSKFRTIFFKEIKVVMDLNPMSKRKIHESIPIKTMND